MLRKIPSVDLVKARIGKRRLAMLEDISIETGGAVVIDIAAKYPLENETTVWIWEFGEDDTFDSAMRYLKYWIDGLEPKPESRNWA